MATRRKGTRRPGRPRGSRKTSGRMTVDRTLPDRNGMGPLKVQLAREITRIIDQRELNQTEAAAIVGDAASQMSLLMSGHLRGFSVERLLRTLLRLGRDVEVVLRPTPSQRRGKLGMRAVGG